MAHDLAVVHPQIERYLDQLVPARDTVLAAMEARARREGIPIVGPVVGRLLHQLAVMTGARRVMELGSAIGYSTVWWARAVGPRGRVWYTDSDPDNARAAAAYFRRAGVADRVKILVGDAVSCMRHVRGRFDIVFCDIDKRGYPAAFRAALPRLVRGGLFVYDNALWGGYVAQGRVAASQDPDTAGIQRLNRMVFAPDAPVMATVIPLRDGVGVAVKR